MERVESPLPPSFAALLSGPCLAVCCGRMPGQTPDISGTCHAFFAYDIALAIRLDKATTLCTQETEREALSGKRRTPSSFQYRPTPVRVIQTGEPVKFGDVATLPRIELTIFDFGAVSVSYQIPLSGPLQGLLTLSDLLYENQALMQDSRRRVADLLWMIRDAVDKPHIADFVEDYAIFEIRNSTSKAEDPELLIAANRLLLAQILRSETGDLSEQEVNDALATRIAYSPYEATIIDWNAAIVLFQRDADDTRAVLEYANVELLELRNLDNQLDDVLDRSYEQFSRPERRARFGLPGRGIRRIAELQVEGAILFEGVNNALKLVGDQYLARVYRRAAERLHLPEWDASIIRKLETAESIYQKLADRQTTRRMEALEWIVIVLIALEIMLAIFH